MTDPLDDDTGLALYTIAAACVAFCSEPETYPIWEKFAAELAEGQVPPDRETLQLTAGYMTLLANRFRQKTEEKE